MVSVYHGLWDRTVEVEALLNTVDVENNVNGVLIGIRNDVLVYGLAQRQVGLGNEAQKLA